MPRRAWRTLFAQLDDCGLERAKQDVGTLVKLMQMVKRRQEAGLLPARCRAIRLRLQSRHRRDHNRAALVGSAAVGLSSVT
jgi:hypothetical protein